MCRLANSSRVAFLGISLAEVMASIVVLTLAIFAVLSVNAMLLRQTRYNEGLQTASTIATGAMAVVEGVLKVDFKTASENISTPVMESSVFKGYEFQVVDGGFVPNSEQKLRSISVGVLWTDSGVNRRYQLDTTFYDY